MNVDEVAAAVMARVIERGQVAMRTDSTTPVQELRDAVRRIAREVGIGVRTGMLEDVLVIARVDAALWDDPARVMRDKLIAPTQPNTLPD
jgi:hypothetical protein